MSNITLMQCPKHYFCSPNTTGTIILPLFNESDWGRGFRAIVYLAGMLWFFMGVAIGADLFMCSIETITSKTKVIRVARQDDVGKGYEEVEVRIWNDTVANLTLMALGSSAPEILLSIIEIVSNNFEAGELGASTIVGSAAFNLLCIIAVCVLAVPKGEVRTIKSYGVFVITGFFSVFAYIWLYLVLAVFSKDEIDMWESVVTFLLFPILVIVSYVADQNYCTRRVQSPQKEDIEMDYSKHLNPMFHQDSGCWCIRANGAVPHQVSHNFPTRLCVFACFPPFRTTPLFCLVIADCSCGFAFLGTYMRTLYCLACCCDSKHLIV